VMAAAAKDGQGKECFVHSGSVGGMKLCVQMCREAVGCVCGALF
jgi:hypothetical protein